MSSGSDPYPNLCSFDFTDYEVYEMTGLDTSKAMGITRSKLAEALCFSLMQASVPTFSNKPELSPDSN